MNTGKNHQDDRENEEGSWCEHTGEGMICPQFGPSEEYDTKNYPTLVHIGLLCLVMVGITLFTSGVVAALSSILRTGFLKPSMIGLIVSEGMLLLTALFFLWVKRMSARDILQLHPITKKVLGASLLLAVSYCVLVGEVDSLVQKFIPIPEFMKTMFTSMTATEDTWDAVLIFIGIVLLPGICEEVFFRGVVLTGFIKQWGTWAGILTTALLFALLHFNPWQLIPLFLIGVLLGYLVVATHSLYPSIIAHSMNNLLSWMAISQTDKMDYQMPASLIWLFILFFIIGIATFKKAIRRPQDADSLT